MKLQLVIGNKNYSSWSMRPWVLLRQAQIPFDEVQLKFEEQDGGLSVGGIDKYSKARKVPVLLIDGEPVWDSLAIGETVAELFPDKKLWPEDARARRMARSICAEMHSGFASLRSQMPMNVRARMPGRGKPPEVRADIGRIEAMWNDCRTRYGNQGPFLYGQFSIADAMYAPVATRFHTYEVALTGAAAEYRDTILGLPALQAWIAGAKAETEVIKQYEP